MAKKKDKNPLMHITPKNLIKEKQKYHLGVDNRMCAVYCHLIDSMAASWGWDLDKVEWTHEDGRRFRGLDPIKSRMEVYRDKIEQGLKVKHVVEDAENSQVLVVLELVRTEGDIKRYQCIRYFEEVNDLGHSFDANHVDIDAVFDWLKDPPKTDGME